MDASRERKVIDRLSGCGMKITPQRVAVLETICKMENHPTAEQVTQKVRERYPNISTATVYNILDAFVVKGLIKKVETGKDVMRYDAILEPHHHLYGQEPEHIADYFDENLDHILEDYFRNKEIPGFSIENIRVQIYGQFNKTH